MHLIDEATAITSEPTRGAVGVNPNSFFRKDSSGGTKVSADFLNALQKEIAYVITQAGDTLDKADDTQLNDAIDTKIATNPFLHYALFQSTLTGSINTWTNTAVAEISNDISGCSVAAGVITLPAGTYRVSGSASVKAVTTSATTYDGAIALFKDTGYTESDLLVLGSAVERRDADAYHDSMITSMVGVFTIASSTDVIFGAQLDQGTIISKQIGGLTTYTPSATLEIWKA